MDSTSAISNVKTLRDLIPKRRFPNHADLLSTMSAAHYVIARFLLTHVHSHQGKDTDLDELPFPAKLNVLCDRIATEHMQRQEVTPEECTLSSPMLPRNLNVEVRYGTQVISVHYVNRLRECIFLTRHRDFLQEKYKWSDQVWVSIAWEALKTCARKPTRLEHPVSRSNVVHNWLNLGTQRYKFGNGGASVELARCCPFCKADEDFTHLLTCKDSRALKFRSDAMLPLSKVLDAEGDAGDALHQAIQVWTLIPTNTLVIDPVDEAFGIQFAIDRAMATQNQISWLNFFRGFVSLDWGKIYPVPPIAPITPDEECRITSDKTLTAVIGAVQDYTIAIWKSRNAVLHEAGSDSLDIANAALNDSITQLYSLQSTLSPLLQSYFKIPLEDLLRRSPRQRKRWLRLARLATSHSSAMGTRQQLLSTYFPYVPLRHENSAVSPSPVECFTLPSMLTQQASPSRPFSVPPTTETPSAAAMQSAIASFYYLPSPFARVSFLSAAAMLRLCPCYCYRFVVSI